MEILNVGDLDLLKSIHYKEELHPRDRKGMFAKKHGIAPSVVTESPKKAPKTSEKVKGGASTQKKSPKGKETPKKTTGKKTSLVVNVPETKKPVAKKTAPKTAAKKTPSTKEATAPKMPPVVDNQVKKRAPRLKLEPALQKPKEPGDLAPDYQNKGRVRVVARRTGSYAVPSTKINSYEDVAKIFADLADSDREKAYVLGTKAGKIVGVHCAHIGNINSALMDPKDMMKVPLLSGSDTVYLIHNHPGGYSRPSPEDIAVTKRFKGVTYDLGLSFGGHLVIGDDNFNYIDQYGELVGFRKDMDRSRIDRPAQAPVYETYQEKDKSVPENNMNGSSDVKDYIQNNLSILDGDKSIYIIGADNQNAVTCAVPLDIKLPFEQLRKQALEVLIKSNSNNFFMYTGKSSASLLENVGIKSASEKLGVNLHDVFTTTTSNKEDIKDGMFSFKSYAENGDMVLVKGLYIDLQKALASGKVTKTQAKALHKDLPPGGVWRSMNGHHIYILNGKVLAGAIPGVKGAKKATKAHLAEHQGTIDKEDKASAKKTKPKTGKEAIEDTLKGANNKESSAKRTKVTPKYMAKQKKAVDKLAGTNAKKKDKKPTLAEQQAEAKKMLEPAPPVKKASEEPKDIMSMIPDMMNPVENPKESEVWKLPFSKFLEASKLRNPNFNMNNASFKNYHKRMVSKALAEGKSVPKNVLAEYPDLAPKKTKKGEVADIHTEAQKNKTTARDVGQKVWGSKKDKASLRAEFEETPTLQGLEELEAVSPEIAQTLCVKKNLLKPVDFEADMNRGVDVNVAMTKQLIYDRIAVKPAEDTPQGRYHYMRATQELQRLLEPAKTQEEFREAVSYLSDYMRKERPKDMEQLKRNLGYSIQESQKEPSEHEIMRGQWNSEKGEWNPISPKERKARIADINQKFKERIIRDLERIAQAEVAGKAPFFPLGKKLTDYFTDGDSRNATNSTVRAKRLTWDKYFTDKQAKKEAPKKEGTTTEKWEKEKLAEITRTGGRKTPVQKPEDMVKTFGFRGVEFGHYVDDKAGAFHLVKSAEALHDLADILGLKDKDISLNGRLALAFGARGSGRALAHYEPDMKTINITKGGGAGSLGHEWGHALDNILYQESIGSPSNNMAADGKMGDVGSPEIKSAYEGLMQAIKVGDGQGISMIKNKKNAYSRYPTSWRVAYEKHGLRGAIEEITKTISAGFDRDRATYEALADRYGKDYGSLPKKMANLERDKKKSINEMVQVMAYLHKKNTGEEPEEIQARTGVTQYFADSMLAGGGSENNYWTRPHEMFARAFETYLQDKMATGKSHNDYLVYGAKGTREGSPYPRGEEAVSIGKAFDKLMNAVRSTGAIQKSLAMLEQWNEERAWEALQKSHGVNIAERSATDIFYTELKNALGQGSPEHINQGTGGIIKRSDLQRSEPTQERSAYNVASTEGVLYIPLNRLQTPYQTEKASNFDKIRENVARMENGENLDPIIIGFNYEVHDGHHKLEASKIRNYTHAPCVIGEFNDIDKQRLFEEYSALWKSLGQKGQGWFAGKAVVDAYKADEHVKDKGYENGPDLSAHASGDYGKVWAHVWCIGQDWNGFWFMIDSEHDKPRLIAYADDEDSSILTIVDPVVPKTPKYSYALWQKVCDAWVLKRAKKLTKSLVYIPGLDTGLGAFPYDNAPGVMFRGIGQKEMDFIQKNGYIQTKGKGNDEDQKNVVTCFSTLFSQAEGYARANYDLYHEKQAYVLVVEYRGTENELGEIEVKGRTPASTIVGVVPVPKTPIAKGLYINLQKSISRADAKKIHKDLPEGGVWRTMSGHHIYIKDGEVLAGVIPGAKGAKKATKAHLAEHQATLDKEASVHKSEKPMYGKAKGGTTSKTKGVDAKMKAVEGLVPREIGQSDKGDVPEKVLKDYPELSPKAVEVSVKSDGEPSKGIAIPPRSAKKLSATNAKRLMMEHGVLAGHREALLQTLAHSTTVNHFRPGEDGFEVQGSKEVVGREYSGADEKIQYYKSNKSVGSNELTYVPVEGKKVDIGGNVHAFIHRGAGGQGWVVTEARTGTMLANGRTRDETTQKAAEAVAKLGPNKLAKGMKQHIEKHGESPATATLGTAGKIFKLEQEQIPYYIAVPKGKSGKAKYIPVHEHAEKVNVGKGVHAFVHGSDGGWTVSEARSGLKIISNSSKNLAIKIAKDLVEHNRGSLDAMIQKHIEKHGESPKTAPTFDDYVKKEVGGSTDHLSKEAWGSYRRSYDYLYNGKR